MTAQPEVPEVRVSPDDEGWRDGHEIAWRLDWRDGAARGEVTCLGDSESWCHRYCDRHNGECGYAEDPCRLTPYDGCLVAEWWDADSGFPYVGEPYVHAERGAIVVRCDGDTYQWRYPAPSAEDETMVQRVAAEHDEAWGRLSAAVDAAHEHLTGVAVGVRSRFLAADELIAARDAYMRPGGGHTDRHEVTEHWDAEGGQVQWRECSCGTGWTADIAHCPDDAEAGAR